MDSTSQERPGWSACLAGILALLAMAWSFSITNPQTAGAQERVRIGDLTAMRQQGYCKDIQVRWSSCQHCSLGSGDHSRQAYADASRCHRECDQDNKEIAAWNEWSRRCVGQRREENAEKLRSKPDPAVAGGRTRGETANQQRDRAPSRETIEKDMRTALARADGDRRKLEAELKRMGYAAGSTKRAALEAYVAEEQRRLDSEAAAQQRAERERREAAEQEHRESKQQEDLATSLTILQGVLGAAVNIGAQQRGANTNSSASGGGGTYRGGPLVTPGGGGSECAPGGRGGCR
jgi:hypothetical protein